MALAEPDTEQLLDRLDITGLGAPKQSTRVFAIVHHARHPHSHEELHRGRGHRRPQSLWIDLIEPFQNSFNFLNQTLYPMLPQPHPARESLSLEGFFHAGANTFGGIRPAVAPRATKLPQGDPARLP